MSKKVVLKRPSQQPGNPMLKREESYEESKLSNNEIEVAKQSWAPDLNLAPPPSLCPDSNMYQEFPKHVSPLHINERKMPGPPGKNPSYPPAPDPKLFQPPPQNLDGYNNLPNPEPQDKSLFSFGNIDPSLPRVIDGFAKIEVDGSEGRGPSFSGPPNPSSYSNNPGPQSYSAGLPPMIPPPISSFNIANNNTSGANTSNLTQSDPSYPPPGNNGFPPLVHNPGLIFNDGYTNQSNFTGVAPTDNSFAPSNPSFYPFTGNSYGPQSNPNYAPPVGSNYIPAVNDIPIQIQDKASINHSIPVIYPKTEEKQIISGNNYGISDFPNNLRNPAIMPSPQVKENQNHFDLPHPASVPPFIISPVVLSETREPPQPSGEFQNFVQSSPTEKKDEDSNNIYGNITFLQQTFPEFPLLNSMYDQFQGPFELDKFRKHKISEYIPDISVDERVETISKYWIHLEIMKGFGKFNATFKRNVDNLKKENHIIGWKKSRGDGNCYYRAVITRYMEIIHKFYNPSWYITYFKELIQHALNTIDTSLLEQSFIAAAAKIIGILDYTYNMKQTDPIRTYIYLMSILENTEYDIYLVSVARLITYRVFLQELDAKRIEHFSVDPNRCIASILTMGEEAEELMLLFLPLGLGCQVVQYNFFNEINVQKFPEKPSPVTIDIVRRSGHYDILYTIKEMEIEQFSFLDGEYNFYQPFQCY